jgi:hypothetical protein
MMPRPGGSRRAVRAPDHAERVGEVQQHDHGEGEGDDVPS